MVRLDGGFYRNSGNVLVYCNGEWGAVCSLSPADGDTVCQQLGYLRAVSITSE